MIRLYLIVIQLFGVFLANFFLSSDVSLKLDVGGQMNAGKELTIQVTLNKGQINGFSRFQLDLPAGVTATNVSSANADFSFKDQKVRYVWLRLPEDESITISFNIICEERLKGNFDLTGKFSYIDQNERKNVDLQTQNITIIPSPNIDPLQLVDIRDYGKLGLPVGVGDINNVACIRQKAVWNEASKDYTITLLVNKESLKKFAKIEETVPAGFSAVNIDSKEGIFAFKENKVKYLWMNLPSESWFTVSYKLVPVKASATPQPVTINGAFSYIIDDKTQLVSVVEKDVFLTNLTAAQVKDILRSPSSGMQKEIAVVPPAASQQPTPEIVVAESQPKAQAQPATKADKAKVADETADLLDPKSGVYYRVQIAAGHKPINIKSYFRKYKLGNSVVKEMHEGWIKYAIGNFTQYRDARDYRVHIWNTTTIADAFVSAYNSGRRITVQEALMIANQKWVQ